MIQAITRSEPTTMKSAFISFTFLSALFSCFLSEFSCDASEEKCRKKRSSATALEDESNKKKPTLEKKSTTPSFFNIQCAENKVVRLHKKRCARFTTITHLLEICDQKGKEAIPVTCSESTLKTLVAFTTLKTKKKQTPFLQTLSLADLLLMVKASNFLNSTVEANSYTDTDVMKHILTTFPVTELRAQGIDTFDYDVTQKTLKLLQLTAIAHDAPEKRNLEHATNLGAEKVAFFKDNNWWNFAITIHDIHTNPATTHLLIPKKGFTFVFLDLKDRHITSLYGLNTIPGLEKLHILTLEKNALTELPEGIFSGLPELQFLNIDNNKLKTIDPNSLIHLTQLKSLFLDHNEITKVKAGTFLNLPNLQTIDLSDNAIETCEQGFFSNVPALQSFCLKNNKLILSEQEKETLFAPKPADCRIIL